VARKNFLINPQFQLSVVGFFTALAILIVAIVYYFQVNFFEKIKSQVMTEGIPANSPIIQFLDQQKHELILQTTIASAVVVLLMIVGGLLLSHRVAGPIYRLRVYFEKNENLNGKKLVFRKNDFFKELETPINNQLDHKAQGS
jgi:DNA integrity scanning protein DisA with diadenylate cyclase activity